MSGILADLVVINEYEFVQQSIAVMEKQGSTPEEILEWIQDYMRIEVEKRKMGHKE